MRPGDVIVGFNGASMTRHNSTDSSPTRIGSTASVRILRNGRTLEMKVPIVSDARRRR